MSRKRTVYSIEFKTKIVLEALRGDKTINEIASNHNITPKHIQNQKDKFLSNAQMAMEPAKALKEYKEEIKELQAKNDEYAKTVGKLTVENQWMLGKLKSLDYKSKQTIVKPKLNISLTRQCQLLGVSRGTLYYTPMTNESKITIKNQIQSIYNEIPIYGYLKVHKQLLEDGFNISPNTVHKYRQEMGLKALKHLMYPKEANNTQYTHTN